MSQSNTEKQIMDIRRNTRCKFSSEEKIRVVLDGTIIQMTSICHRPELSLLFQRAGFSIQVIQNFLDDQAYTNADS